MFITVTTANYIQEYKIEFQFSDGKTGIVDLFSSLTGPVFQSLQDMTLFCDFSIDPDLETIVWSNGADLAPEYLYFQAFKNDISLREQFIQWGYLSSEKTN